ncbi:MAG: hypothetical protein LBL04_11355 [Bacteroidales bacterium]|nr:hypothetical protein [Bacteroidales bacterium]
MNALLRRSYGINPDSLTDSEWLNLYAEYQYTERQRYDTMVLAHKQALAEIINAAFGNEQQDNTVDS